MKLHPSELVSERTRLIAGLVVTIRVYRGGPACDWRQEIERTTVSIAHPHHFGRDDSLPTYTATHGEGPTTRAAVARAVRLARHDWHGEELVEDRSVSTFSGRTLWGT